MMGTKEGTADFPYTISFGSPNWSKNTVRSIGPENIKRYVEIFNKDNNAPASAYRNLGPKKSISRSAPYLVKLLKLVKQ